MSGAHGQDRGKNVTEMIRCGAMLRVMVRVKIRAKGIVTVACSAQARG